MRPRSLIEVSTAGAEFLEGRTSEQRGASSSFSRARVESFPSERYVRNGPSIPSAGDFGLPLGSTGALRAESSGDPPSWRAIRRRKMGGSGGETRAGMAVRHALERFSAIRWTKEDSSLSEKDSRGG
ncbi:hypothetical protein KM043_001603 [Ampulex compressa]|nr:hypothetical protein KM043_001603 [Ampulex compressa]